MDDQYVSMILLFGFDYAPRYWKQCNGELLPIQQNQALFALLGTYYGGNGIQNFALPDLRGRVGIGFDNSYLHGSVGGTETYTLNTFQLPSHIDQIPSTSATGSVSSPLNARLALVKTASGPNVTFLNTYAPPGTMPAGSLNSAGQFVSASPFSLMQPYMVLNYCIAMLGLFPSRN